MVPGWTPIPADMISIHASDDPDATLRWFTGGRYRWQISIHASDDPDATAMWSMLWPIILKFQSTHPKIRMRPANNGLVKPLQRFTAKTKCFEFAKASPNKTSTWISWCETPVTFMCNSGSHAFLRQQFSSKDHSKTVLPLLYCPI